MIPHITFMKHAEKVTKGVSAARPALQGVYHGEDGVLIVTDGHRLYRAKSEHTAVAGTIVNPNSGLSISDGSYPDVSRIIPSNDGYVRLKIPTKQTVDAFKALQQVAMVQSNGVKRKKSDATLSINVKEDGSVFAETNGMIKASYPLGTAEAKHPTTITFNAEYAIQALELFYAADKIDVSLGIYTPLTPFTFKTDDLLALIMPIRGV